MGKFWNKTLTRQMIWLFFRGLIVAAVLFSTLCFAGNAVMDNFFMVSDFIYNAETKYVKELSEYAQKENIKATDTERLGAWAHKKRVRHFTVSRDRVMIYDSAYSDSVILDQMEAESLHYNWQYFHTVTFADGDADVYIYADYEVKYYLFFYFASGTLCVLVWILLFALGIHKQVVYIQKLGNEVAKIEQGSLDSEIPLRGNDELGVLASGLNQMRLALIEKNEIEKRLKDAQDKLVLGMAHDLRTPLTGLMAFLEIARKQTDLEDCKNYLDRAYNKSSQICNLSNQLFEFFLINSEQPLKMEEPENVEYALGEYLSELCALLAMDGYSVVTDDLYWKPLKIQICIDYIGRIIDNLVSNIKKYADPTQPIELVLAYTGSYACVTIQNKPAHPNQYVHGTGIGVKNIHAMMRQMGGFSKVYIDAKKYAITLCFLIRGETEE